MFATEFDYQNERYKEMLREAENERFARKVAGRNKLLTNARRALGRNLVNVGQQLLNER